MRMKPFSDRRAARLGGGRGKNLWRDGEMEDGPGAEKDGGEGAPDDAHSGPDVGLPHERRGGVGKGAVWLKRDHSCFLFEERSGRHIPYRSCG